MNKNLKELAAPYAKGFIGQNLFGTMVKKKENTTEWFKEYLTDIKKSVTLANQ